MVPQDGRRQDEDLARSERGRTTVAERRYSILLAREQGPGDYLQEAYLVGLVDNAAGLGGLAVSLAARELGL